MDGFGGKANEVRFTSLLHKLAERRQYGADVCYGNVKNDDSHFPF